MQLTALLTVAMLTTVGVGCTADEQTKAVPSDPCRAAIDEAADQAEIRRQIELLDRAVVVCDSPEAFAAGVERHPTLLGWDTATFLGLRCTNAESAAVRGARICQTDAIVPPTTAPTADAPTVVFVGVTLDDREVSIRPTPNRPFTDDGQPLIMDEMARIAMRTGCNGLESEYRRWLAQIDDPERGDEASVYARHALDVAIFIGCQPTW